ncbi:MAG: DMT family transporter [Burkholderiales bacterium]|jgi:drug/metabolite transporter (DMT)-like permease|nr:DMT family transporter [Burkholderiales bacterium]
MTTFDDRPPQINATDLLMVLIVTVSWGMNYPVMKFVVNDYPPSAFRAFTFLIGFMSLGAYAYFKGISIVVPKNERRSLFILSLFNMVGWHLPMIYGVSMLNSGRAAIIGYTMPVWALIASAILYREKITVSALLGIVLAMSAALLLAWGSAGQWGNHPLGIAVMLLAAITWGIGNAMMKNSKLSVNGITLTFWALFIAFVFFVAITTIFEQHLWVWPNFMQWLAILYGGVITFAVSYVAWFHVARKLSAVSSGLSITLVPVFGVMGGALVLGEKVTLPDIVALFFILFSMLVVLFPNFTFKALQKRHD